MVSNEPWGDIWFSKQHYAFELAKLGHDVYFINPTKRWTLSNLFSYTITEEQINDHLKILSYKNNFPQGNFFQFFVKINDLLNCLKIKCQINLDENNLIWWKFDPYRFLTMPTQFLPSHFRPS